MQAQSNDNDNSEHNDPASIIARLQAQIDEKEDEILGLSMSLSATEAEAQAAIHTAERSAAQTVRRLEEELRRVQHEADSTRWKLSQLQSTKKWKKQETATAGTTTTTLPSLQSEWAVRTRASGAPLPNQTIDWNRHHQSLLLTDLGPTLAPSPVAGADPDASSCHPLDETSTTCLPDYHQEQDGYHSHNILQSLPSHVVIRDKRTWLWLTTSTAATQPLQLHHPPQKQHSPPPRDHDKEAVRMLAQDESMGSPIIPRISFIVPYLVQRLVMAWRRQDSAIPPQTVPPVDHQEEKNAEKHAPNHGSSQPCEPMAQTDQNKSNNHDDDDDDDELDIFLILRCVINNTMIAIKSSSPKLQI